MGTQHHQQYLPQLSWDECVEEEEEEKPTHHNPDIVAQRLGLLHAVSREYHAALSVLSRHATYDVPHEATGDRIHT